MNDIAELLLALIVVLAPLGLAWWLIRDRPPRPRVQKEVTTRRSVH
jgi:hypothetical protein